MNMKSILLPFFCCLFTAVLFAQSRAPYTPPTESGQYIGVVQKSTFNFFWDMAHPVSGMTPERNATPDIVTTGGSGFGIMSIVVGAYRGWITREQAVQRLLKTTNWLARAERFHGAWSHWVDGNTGKVVPFGQYDNGGDLVETAYLMNGLLVARAFFDGPSATEKELRTRITKLWEEVEWDWYVHNGLLHWHWSKNYEWKMNHPIGGYNECLITYVLAMGSPTHPISKKVYEDTWKKHESDHYVNGKTYLGYTLPLGFDWGGPLFFAHYSYLSLDPRWMEDENTNYWQLNVNQTLINRAHCIERAPRSYGYSELNWGLTASDNYQFYGAHQPTEDNGTISPTAALSSFPYTPYFSYQALMYFYRTQGNRLFTPFGFYDAYNVKENWYSNQYLAIDQGPIVVMIENYRSGLLWSLGSKIKDLQTGLANMGIHRPNYPTGFYQYVAETNSGAVHLMKHPDGGRYVLDFYVAGATPVTITLTSAKNQSTISLAKNQVFTGGAQQLPFDASGGTYLAMIRQGDKEIGIKLELH
jgi:hypothetical protein